MREKKGATQQAAAPVYRAADFYMLRAPVLPAHIFSQMASESREIGTQKNGATDHSLLEARQHGHEILQVLARQPVIEQALAAASSAIFEGLACIQRGEISRRTERAYSRLLRYMIRMSTRPTPFGLFAGVAVGTFTDQTTVTLGTPTVRQIRTRPDMSWVMAVIQDIEQAPALFPQLFLVANQTAYLTGERVVLPYADIYGRRDDRSISMRATPVVLFALQRSRHPIHYRELRASLLETFSQASAEQIDRLLQQLWENHFLTSNLRPPLTEANPAHYVVEQLSMVSDAARVSLSLKEVLQKTAKIDQAGIGGPVEFIRDLTQHQEQLARVGQHLPFQIDTALRLESSHLNKSIGEAAAHVGETLLRLGHLPRGPFHLEEYRSAFMERYGLGAEVPLLDLLSPESGLDAPSTYLYPPRTHRLPNAQPPPDQRRRDMFLCGLVVQAVKTGSLEVELTESLLQQLEQWSPQTSHLTPSSLEIYLQLHATSREALDQGDWRVVVSPNCGSPGGGRTFSRFFDVLGPESLEKLQGFTRQEESCSSEVVFAELSYLPTSARAANVTTRPILHDYEIVINSTPSVSQDKVISLDDLVVGVQDNRFYLRSLRLGKEVVVCQSHMLNAMSAPNICRFLLEIAQDNRPVLSPFDWGIASASPFLPRLVQEKIVLCPAQWNLKIATIEPTGSGSEELRWFNGLQQWRSRWHVPRYVYVVEADNRLLLDLEHPLMATELRAELLKNEGVGSVRIQEMLPDFDHLWLRDSQNVSYFAEIVVPLIRKDVNSLSSAAATSAERLTPPRVVSREERRMFPGGAWTYLKLYAASRQHEGLIAGPIREIVQRLLEYGMIDRWFFVRYADPEPHVRLRFRTANAHEARACESLLTTTLAWGRQLAQSGLLSRVCADVYDREVERYGGPIALEILEQVFTINSAVISEIIASQYTRRLSLDPPAIAVFSLDQFFAAWGLDLAERVQYLENHAEKQQGKKAFHSQRKLCRELLDPWNQSADPGIAAQRAQLCALLSVQEEPLQTLSAQLRRLAAKGDLWLSEARILDSLAHMHVNRLLGINREQEINVYAFWRSALESIHRRSLEENLHRTKSIRT